MNFDQKLKNLQEEIGRICEKKGSDPNDITILAATKYADAAIINKAITAGIQTIGENRVQDAQVKIPELLTVKKHFIGHLQKNKVKKAVELFDCIESIDSIDIAEKIDEEAQKMHKIMPIYIEINIAQDPKKFGVDQKNIDDFFKKIQQYKNIRVEGLMTIVPFSNDPEETRPYFRMMRKIFEESKKTLPELRKLSMGMSHDYTIAIEEGSTEVRIGSYFFQK